MSVRKALEPRFDIDVDPDGWVLPNRSKFPTWIDKNFKYGKRASAKPGCGECDAKECEAKPKKQTLEIFAHQRFVKDYMQYSSPYRGILLYHSLGSGKCHRPGTPILMFDGSIKKVEDVRVDDLLMGDDSTPRRVLSLARGRGKMFDVIPRRGDVYTVNDEHLLCLKDPSTGEMYTQNAKNVPSNSTIHGFKSSVEFPEKPTPVDPYEYGKSCEGIGIDEIYRVNSKSVRELVLRGMIESIGESTLDGFRVRSVHPDVLYLIRSLGHQAYVYRGESRVDYSDGSLVPMTVEPAGEGEYRGFMVDRNHRYLLGDFTVTHNSCTSIAAAELLMNHMDVVVLLPASLHGNYMKEVRKCGRRYFDLRQHWKKVEDPSDEDLKLLRVSPKLVKRHRGLWIPRADAPANFQELPQESQRQIVEQTNDVIENRFKFIHFDGLRKESIKAMTAEGNPFDNKCVVVDEVHNLISRIVNGGVTGKPIYNLLMSAKNCKLILLSGTPVINYPHEISYVVNLITGYRVLYVCDVLRGSFEQLETHLKKTRQIDYYSIDRMKKKLQFTLLPEGFSWKSRSGLEVLRSTPKSELDRIVDELKEIGIQISDPVVYSSVRKPSRPSDKYYKMLPEEEDVFNSIFVDMEKLVFKNEELFMRRVLGAISYYSSMSPELFPSVEIEERGLPMPPYMFKEYQDRRSDERSLEGKKPGGKGTGNLFRDSGEVYRFYSRAVCNFVFPSNIKREFPADLRKMKREVDDVDDLIAKSGGPAGSAPTKSEVDRKYESMVSKAMRELRESDHLALENLRECSPKYHEIVTRLNDLDGIALVYSQFRKVEGLGLLCASLDKNGWSEFRIGRNEHKEWELDIDEGDLDKPHYFQFRGNNEETNILLSILNSDFENVPHRIREKLWRESNLRGELIKLIMITQSGSEGISLKNVRQVHVLEPFWNHVRIDQVIGRAVRTCSHEALPPKDRKVNVYIYYMIFTNDQLKESFTIRVKDKSMTSDQYLYDLAKKKKRIVDGMLGLLKRAAVDCALNSKTHGGSKCFSFPTNVEEDKFAQRFAMSDETFDSEYKQEIEEKEWKGQVIVTRRGRFLLRKETNEIYDYDIYVDANRLVKLGDLAVDSTGRKVVRIRRNQASRDPSPKAPRSPSPKAPRSPSPKAPRSPSPKAPRSPSPKAPRSPSPKAPRSPSPKAPRSPSPKLDLGLLKYDMNSCYLDTFLVSIMHRPNAIVDLILNAKHRFAPVKNRLTLAKLSTSIQDLLRSVYGTLRETRETLVCTDLRQKMEKFDAQYRKQIEEKLEDIEWTSTQNEPKDVIDFLDRVFVLDPNTTTQMQETSGVKNPPEKKAFNYLAINATEGSTHVRDYLPKWRDEFYNNEDRKNVFKVTECIDTTGLFVYVQRGEWTDEGKVKSTNVCTPSESFELANKKSLDLISIIVHHGESIDGGHYTCYIKSKNAWYHYDNMGPSYSLVGRFDDIPKSAFKNCNGFVYV